MIHYDIVDIGTGDHDVSNIINGERNTIGGNIPSVIDPTKKTLLVEPLEIYLNRYKNLENVTLCNVAIGDEISNAKIHYLEESFISTLPDNPWWLKGCNKVNQVHQLISFYPQQVKTKNVKMITFDKLCELHDIQSIGDLKIDTEGYEVKILPQVISKIEQEGMRIDTIQVEHNDNLLLRGTADVHAMHQMYKRLIALGYKMVPVEFFDFRFIKI